MELHLSIRENPGKNIPFGISDLSNISMGMLFCSVCGKLLTTQYYVDYWGNPFCITHRTEYDTCFSCNRLVTPRLTNGGIKYSNAITVCNLCRKTEVIDTKTVYDLFHQVKKRLAFLGLDLRRIPIYVRLTPITAAALGSYSKRWTGLTQKSIFSRDGKIMGQRVDEIKILRGLPAEQIQSILAHEAGHAWLGLNGFPPLQPFIEEGLCELIDYFWLLLQTTNEARYRIYLKFNNPDPIYGAGFKAAYAAMSGRTLAELLNFVKTTQNFPRK